MLSFRLIALVLTFFSSYATALQSHQACSASIELQEFIDAFPYENYQIYHVPGQGSFYIEPQIDDIVKNVLKAGFQWEAHNLEIINTYAQKESLVLDIGAHIGSFVVRLSEKVGPNGSVIAFEPQRKIYRELIKNCELNGLSNVQCINCAIGDAEKVVAISKEDQMKYPNSEGSWGIGVGDEYVNMITIDSLNLSNLSFVLIDVERSEEYVLAGMVETIRRNKPVILIELQGGYLIETAPNIIREKIIQCISFLTNEGYKVIRVKNHDYLAIPQNI